MYTSFTQCLPVLLSLYLYIIFLYKGNRTKIDKTFVWIHFELKYDTEMKENLIYYF